jgi:hypothetical protein
MNSKEDKIKTLLNSKRLKISDIYKYYKFGLVTRKQKQDLKDELMKNKFVEEVYGKNYKIIGYDIIEDNKDNFKKWMFENLII